LGCKTSFSIKRKDFDDGRGIFCNMKCYIKHSKNTFPKGSSHPNWKNGKSFEHGYHCKYGKAYKERKLKAGGSFTSEEWILLKKKYNYTCLCCKQQEPFIVLTADHIIPLSRGGKNSVENIQPLCRQCNSRKYVNTVSYIPTI
jgi:5-methylcytosine-specific restriction endonuclease McrA